MISGSRNIATDHNGNLVTIQSNNHPSIKLRWNSGGNGQYELLHNNRLVFGNTTAGTTYNTLYSNFANRPSKERQEGQQWATKGDVTEAINAQGGKLAAQGGEGGLPAAEIYFSGSNLAEGIS